MASKHKQVTSVLRVVQRVLTRHLLHAAELKAHKGHGAAVTLIQCLGSATIFTSHLHCLLLDGMYRCGRALLRPPDRGACRMLRQRH
jgi:hypothetical protein